MVAEDQAFVAQARALLEGVTQGQAAISQFERAFLQLYADAPTSLPAHDATALEEVFWAVENYVDDPDLREPHELDDGQLLEVVARALEVLTDVR